MEKTLLDLAPVILLASVTIVVCLLVFAFRGNPDRDCKEEAERPEKCGKGMAPASAERTADRWRQTLGL